LTTDNQSDKYCIAEMTQHAENPLGVASDPQSLGLPAKFTSFRQPQRQALDWLLNECVESTNAACLATGAGKTLIAVALARLLGVRAVYVVATKALQQQILGDFGGLVADIRGRANYRCSAYGNCEAGYDAECSRSKTDGCPYTRAVEAANLAPLAVTNYAYWLHARKHNSEALEKYDPIGLLICDEAHNAGQQLSEFVSVRLHAGETGKYKAFAASGVMYPGPEEDAHLWRVWAKDKLEALGNSTDEDDVDLADRCRRILKMTPNWIWQADERTGHVTFEPVRLNGYTRSLFSGIPRVLMMSASLNEFTLRLLMSQDQPYNYRAWPSVFPPSNAPVYHLPTVKLTWKSTDEDYKKVIEAMDAIIDSRADRKTIVHTVSYARSERALRYSRHAGRFIRNTAGSELPDCLDRFRSAGPGTILVTPSVEEGFDFPDTQCEVQICLKFPFPNETQRVIKERCAQIPGYRLHYAAQKLVQMRGRAVRSETDRSELFVLDNAVRQLGGPDGRSYTPPGFRIFTVQSVPPAPPRVTPVATPKNT
jgi:Rad3-related DNA helicase